MPASNIPLAPYVPEPEVVAILGGSCFKRYGVVEVEDRPHKEFFRHEVPKIYMRRHYPSIKMRSDLIGSLDVRTSFNIPVYFQHQPANKKENMERARSYLMSWETNGLRNYMNRLNTYDDYKTVIKRKNSALKRHYRELKLLHHKTGHIHFLHQMLFIKNLWSYPLPKVWIYLLALQLGTPSFERILAAIRVLTDYDGDRAPEFYIDLF